MRHDSYIPIISNNHWEIRFCTLGNWDFGAQGVEPYIYTHIPVLISVMLKDVTQAEEIRLSFVNTNIPTASYLTPEPVNGKSTLEIDVTDYIKAKCGTITINFVSEGDTESIYFNAAHVIDGVPAHSLAVPCRNGAVFESGEPPLGDGSFAINYGHLPSKVTASDVVEVIEPLDVLVGTLTFAQWKAIYDAYIEEQGDAIPWLWRVAPAGYDDPEVLPVASNKYMVVGEQSVDGGATFVVPTTYPLLWLYDMSNDYEGSITPVATIDDVFTEPMMVEKAPTLAQMDKCGMYRRVKWRSRIGNRLNALFDVVQTKEETKDEYQLQDIANEYKGGKGAATRITIEKSGLNAFDVWYYGGIVLSNQVELQTSPNSINYVPCKVISKSVNADIQTTAAQGEYYTLTIELEVFSYGAY